MHFQPVIRRLTDPLSNEISLTLLCIRLSPPRPYSFHCPRALIYSRQDSVAVVQLCDRSRIASSSHAQLVPDGRNEQQDPRPSSVHGRWRCLERTTSPEGPEIPNASGPQDQVSAETGEGALCWTVAACTQRFDWNGGGHGRVVIESNAEAAVIGHAMRVWTGMRLGCENRI